MKRLIGLIVVFLLSFTLFFSYEIDSIKYTFLGVMPFLENVYNFIDSFLVLIKNSINLDFLSSLPVWLIDCIIYAVLFIGFSIVWYLVFGIIVLIRKIIRKSKVEIALNGGTIVLSEEQKSKFEWKLYQRKFPIRRLLFSLFLLGIFALFIVIRFDYIFTVENAVKFGDILYFNEVIDRHAADNLFVLNFYASIVSRLGSVGAFISNLVANYIRFMNIVVDTVGFKEIEWIILGIVIVVFLVIFWGINSIFANVVRKRNAKKRARKLKNKYVAKLENIELKAWKKGQKESRVSEKNRTLYNQEIDIPEIDNDVRAIADNKKAIKEFAKVEIEQSPEQNYIDDISTGVTDLGVIQEDNNELQKPLFNRQTHFVGEEEHDILLEEEPIIETIEEEDSYYNDSIMEETFERYQPEFLSTLNLEDKIKKYNIDVIEENETIELYDNKDTIPIEEFSNREYSFSQPQKDSTEEKKVDDLVKENKPVKPLTLKSDRSRIINYIIDTASDNSLALSEEEKKNIATIKPLKPVEPVKHVEKQKEEVKKETAKPLKPIIKKEKKNIKPVGVKR